MNNHERMNVLLKNMDKALARIRCDLDYVQEQHRKGCVLLNDIVYGQEGDDPVPSNRRLEFDKIEVEKVTDNDHYDLRALQRTVRRLAEVVNFLMQIPPKDNFDRLQKRCDELMRSGRELQLALNKIDEAIMDSKIVAEDIKMVGGPVAPYCVDYDEDAVVKRVQDYVEKVNTRNQKPNPPRDHAEDHKTMDVTVTLTWEEASSMVNYINVEKSGPGYERAFKKIKQAMENRK